MASSCQLDHELGASGTTRLSNLARGYESVEHDTNWPRTTKPEKLGRDCETATFWESPLNK